MATSSRLHRRCRWHLGTDSGRRRVRAVRGSQAANIARRGHDAAASGRGVARGVSCAADGKAVTMRLPRRRPTRCAEPGKRTRTRHGHPQEAPKSCAPSLVRRGRPENVRPSFPHQADRRSRGVRRAARDRVINTWSDIIRATRTGQRADDVKRECGSRVASRSRCPPCRSRRRSRSQRRCCIGIFSRSRSRSCSAATRSTVSC